ncbi:putative bifunctional diguanylate cyclase/phosphodiesterase [Thiosocius teredinicola]|uniref:putative bifunctional diguanylate cyclase/phosphodiesterase n=1 Tax=Thiosocius teredinicola TaxID=1973002 RepID=UPI000F7B6C06
MPQSRFRQFRGFWLSWGIITVLAGAITLSIYTNERIARLDQARAAITTESSYLRHILGSSLRNGDFYQLRDQIKAWGELNSTTTQLRLTAENGFVLGEFRRDLRDDRVQQQTEELPYSYRGTATLFIEQTLEPVYENIAMLGWQLAGAFVTLELLGVIMIYQLMRHRRQVQLTQDEYDRRLEAQNALERMATLDALTGLPNRYMLDEQLWLRIAEAGRFKRKLALLFIDLDNFKTINDSFGHEAGDTLLKSVADRMGTCLRGYDLLARFGGDEFIVLLSSIGSVDEVEHVAEKIIRALEPRIEVVGQELVVSSSIGISMYPDDGGSPGDLLRKADAAMYTAKEAGRNTFRFYAPSMNEAVAHRQHIEQSLHRAFENDELYLVYQPQIDIETGLIVSCEALIRWGTGGTHISPEEFIPIAEQSALMKQVQTFVINQAIQQRAAWKHRGMRDVRVDINLSGGSLVIRDVIPYLLQTLKQHGLNPADIGIELTERALIEASEETISGLEHMRTLGSHVSLDDFGTGYSSLGYLKHLPVDVLKIDRTFVKDLPDDPQDCAIVQAVVAMGHSMGKKILAEGVESGDQLAYVRRQGCDFAQGYLLHRPLDAEAFEQAVIASEAESRRAAQHP